MYNPSIDLVWLTWISVLLYLGPGIIVGIFWLFRQRQEAHEGGKAPHVPGYITTPPVAQLAEVF
jgi:Na+/proline symporter